MERVITTVEQVTPQWLTQILKREKLLGDEQVLGITVHPNVAFNSTITHFTLTFSAPVPPAVPQQVLLKCNLPADWARAAGQREVQFYQMVAHLPDHPSIIVPCLDAAYDPHTGDSHLLLSDLSESHDAPITRDQLLDPSTSVPPREQIARVIDTLARLHAFWWQHPQLGTGIARVGTWCNSEQHIVSENARRQRAWDDLWAHEHTWFPPALRALYETLLQQQVSLWKTYTFPRLAAYTHLTLTHGDAYFSNFLCPRPGYTGDTYLIDWQGPEVYRGTIDVVNLCATFWTRAQRAEHEQWILERYYASLCAHGVTHYSWEDLVVDYQLAIIDWLLNTLQDRLDGAERSYWFTKMQCLADAFDDWQGQRLFMTS